MKWKLLQRSSISIERLTALTESSSAQDFIAVYRWTASFQKSPLASLWILQAFNARSIFLQNLKVYIWKGLARVCLSNAPTGFLMATQN